MIWLAWAFTFIAGTIAGIALTMRMIQRAIRRADLREGDKRMIREVLGVRP